jgi:hypothetical protein
VDIAANISEFLGAVRQPAGRDASFDYCFNYFQSFRNNRNIDGIVASQNVEIIDGHQIPTLDFLTGQPTGILYSKAKIIDMIGTVEGARLAKDD